jgi:plastocyanin
VPAVAAALALSAVAAPSLVQAHVKAHTAGATVNVAASEFKFVLSTKSAAPGTVTFKVTNKGHVQHDFKIDGKKTALISPGKSATLKVTMKKGSYPYLCTVPGHAAAGMKGTFKVT